MRRKKKVFRIWRFPFPGVGFFIFLVFFLYIIFNIVFYLYRDKTSIYRVVSDVRIDEINGIGLILRDEVVNETTSSGYINYFVSPLSIVAKNDIIYSVDSTGNIYHKLTVEDTKEIDDNNSMKAVLYQFYANDKDYSSIYELKRSLKESVYINSSKNVLTNLRGVMKNYGGNSYFNINRSAESGIVVYGVDGMENMDLSQIDMSLFLNSGEVTGRYPPENSSKIDVGEPVYKLIRDEKWKVVLPITEEEKLSLSDVKSVNTILDGSSYTARANVEVIEKNEQSYAVLTFYNYMVNFAEKRFVNVYMKLNQISGLKIAKSSVVEKNFYVIPIDFFVYNGELGSEKGLILFYYDKKGVPIFEFKEVQSFYETKEFAYISADAEFSAGNQISKTKDPGKIGDNDYTHTISKMETLKGVYNVNKGFPEFKKIDVISEIENDYYLVSYDPNFGLSEYDNIILNARLLEKKREREER